jgi:hypothetical protein
MNIENDEGESGTIYIVNIGTCNATNGIGS